MLGNRAEAQKIYEQRKTIKRKNKEIERLNNIINKTIECIDYWRDYDGDYSVEEEELIKILKGEDK